MSKNIYEKINREALYLELCLCKDKILKLKKGYRMWMILIDRSFKKLTFQEIGEKHHITKERVRQIYEQGLLLV